MAKKAKRRKTKEELASAERPEKSGRHTSRYAPSKSSVDKFLDDDPSEAIENLSRAKKRKLKKKLRNKITARQETLINERRLQSEKDQPLDTIAENTSLSPSDMHYCAADCSTKLNIKECRGQLVVALNQESIRMGGLTPMQRIAKLFYTDDAMAVRILKHLLPELKATELTIDQEKPFQILVEAAESVSDDSEEDNDPDILDLEAY